jgi:NAD(P)-dependent dehydrogenase (short-subunit alcohol dehydrogenase family)
MSNLNIAIFGSSGAIGRSLCLEYAKSKNTNKIFAFSRDNVTSNDMKIINRQVNYLDENSLKQATEILNVKLDLIIITTGALKNPEKSIKDLSIEKFMKMFEANTLPTALISKYFLPILYKDRITKFTALSARVGSIEDNHLGGWYSYRASKTALNMVLKNLSIEQQRINPNSIVFGLHPGTVNSPLSKPFQRKNMEYFSPEFSAEKLKEVISLKTIKDNGKIFAWDNSEIKP